MATKKMTDNSKPCTCSKCGVEARSIAGTRHRRCGGAANAPIRPKHSATPGARGTWT